MSNAMYYAFAMLRLLRTLAFALGLPALGACGSETPPAEAPGAPSGKRPPCVLGQDQACNDDPKVSALWGRCTELGVCECKPGFELSVQSGRCRPAH